MANGAMQGLQPSQETRARPCSAEEKKSESAKQPPHLAAWNAYVKDEFTRCAGQGGGNHFCYVCGLSWQAQHPGLPTPDIMQLLCAAWKSLPAVDRKQVDKCICLKRCSSLILAQSASLLLTALFWFKSRRGRRHSRLRPPTAHR
jgi:hypothetical protein